MQKENLPKNYKGFLTEELLALLNMRMSHQSLKGVPKEKISAMNDLAREFLLTPVHQNSPEARAIQKK